MADMQVPVAVALDSIIKTLEPLSPPERKNVMGWATEYFENSDASHSRPAAANAKSKTTPKVPAKRTAKPKNSAFAASLKKYRKKLGISQGAAADSIGISRSSYINYEAGKSYPRKPETMASIAKALECKPEDLDPSLKSEKASTDKSAGSAK